MRAILLFSFLAAAVFPFVKAVLNPGERRRWRMRTVLALVFTAAARCPAQTFDTIYRFKENQGGIANPQSKLAVDSRGVLYGVSQYGGEFRAGTVYSATPPSNQGGAWTVKVLYSFSKGTVVFSDLALGPNSALYGTTTDSAFQLIPPKVGGGSWTFETLYEFTGGSDGGYPSGGVIFGAGGQLYGSTQLGGIGDNGVLYSLAAPAQAGGKWVQTVLYSFLGGSDGSAPQGDLTLGPSGSLFGATSAGGVSGGFCTAGCGTLFELSPPAAGAGLWTKTTIHSFALQGDGITPVGGMVRGSRGELYGSTTFGGTSNVGAIFELAPSNLDMSQWTESVLFSFSNAPDVSSFPNPLTLGTDGDLYGTTYYGGSANFGSVFRLAAPVAVGNQWTFSVLHDFLNNGDGLWPSSAVVAGEQKEALYATTAASGVGFGGTLYRIVK